MLADALDRIRSDKGRDGRYWYPQGAAPAFTFAIANHGAEVRGYVHQAVRLIRLAELAGGRGGHASFLFARLPSLRAEYFRGYIHEAMRAGSLAGRVELFDRGVRFLEPAMNGKSAPFDLAYQQMPAATAMLSVLIGTLGDLGKERLAPILGMRCTASAGDLAQQLYADFKDWLKTAAVASEDEVKQERRIWEFLSAAPHAVGPGDITDQSILEFWEDANRDEAPVDGFRSFRSAARKMLGYRSLMVERQTESRFSPLDRDTGRAFDLADTRSNVIQMKVQPRELEIGQDSSSSPLLDLQQAPANEAKWLRSQEEAAVLADLFGDGRAGDDAEDDGKDLRLRPLFRDGPPTAEFYLTLARYTFFGRWQNAISSQLKEKRNRIDFERALDNTLDKLRGPLAREASYALLIDRYQGIAKDLPAVAGATAWSLAVRRDVNAIVGLEGFGADMVETLRDEIATHYAGQEGRRPNRLEQLAIVIGLEGSRVGAALKKAYKAIDRAGWRDMAKKSKVDELGDPKMGAALAAGIAPLVALIPPVANAARWLAVAATAEAFEHDMLRFRANFEAMYVDPSLQEAPNRRVVKKRKARQPQAGPEGKPA